MRSGTVVPVPTIVAQMEGTVFLAGDAETLPEVADSACDRLRALIAAHDWLTDVCAHARRPAFLARSLLQSRGRHAGNARTNADRTSSDDVVVASARISA
jgi:hypothetical protein